MTRAIARLLPRATSKSHADAGLNLAVYGGAALLCGVSAPAACAVLLGWTLWRMRARARAAGDRVLSFGGPFARTAGVSVLIGAFLFGIGMLLILGALGFAVVMAPDLPVYSSPILTEVLPPLAE